MQKEIKDGHKIPKGSFENNMRKWEPKKYCLNKDYNIGEGPEWELKNKIFEGENKVNSSNPNF